METLTLTKKKGEKMLQRVVINSILPKSGKFLIEESSSGRIITPKEIFLKTFRDVWKIREFEKIPLNTEMLKLFSNSQWESISPKEVEKLVKESYNVTEDHKLIKIRNNVEVFDIMISEEKCVETEEYDDLIPKKEYDKEIKSYSELGKILSSINFSVNKMETYFSLGLGSRGDEENFVHFNVWFEGNRMRISFLKEVSSYYNKKSVSLSIERRLFHMKFKSPDDYFMREFFQCLIDKCSVNRDFSMFLRYTERFSLIHEAYSGKENKKIYNHFKVKNKNGKMRDIYAPVKSVKSAHRDLLQLMNRILLSKKERFIHNVGFMPKKNIKTTVEEHLENKYWIKLDFKNFFDTCSRELVSKHISFIFKEDSHSARLETILDNVLINPNTGGLYQGFPLSGAITNFITAPIMRYVYNILNSNNSEANFKVSIYADDILISSKKFIKKGYILGVVNHAINFYTDDLTLNMRKTKLMSNQRRKWLGATVNHRNELVVSKDTYKFYRARIFNIANGVIQDSFGKKELGRINFLFTIDKKLRKYTMKFKNSKKSNRLEPLFNIVKRLRK